LGDLEWANAEYRSVRGKIMSQWELKKDELRLKLNIPANTTATVFLPTPSAAMVKEGRRHVAESKELVLLKYENGHAVLKVPSGAYDFRMPVE